MRYLFIREHEKVYPIRILCKVMNVSRSAYYRFKSLEQKAPRKTIPLRLILEVKAIHKGAHGSYGSRRMSNALKNKGFNVGRYQARSLMRKAQIQCKQRKRFRVTQNAKQNGAIAENTLNREFNVTLPNQVWVADITYLWTRNGWAYLAAVVDLFSRRVIGWSIAEHMQEELVNKALTMAIAKRRPKKGLLHHSDRGTQYTSTEYQKLLSNHSIDVSMSRKGNCWDNVVMERFFGSLKSEYTDSQSFESHEDAEAGVNEYIENFYNKERLHSTLSYLSPVEYEKRNQHLF